MKNTYDVLKKARDLKDEGYHMAVSIREKSTGTLGNASLSDDDVWVRLPGDEFFINLEEFNRDFEITAITMDDGKTTREFEPKEFLKDSTDSSYLSEQDEGQKAPVMEMT